MSSLNKGDGRAPTTPEPPSDRCARSSDGLFTTMQAVLAQRGASTKLDALSESLKCQACGGKEFDVLQCYGPEVWSG